MYRMFASTLSFNGDLSRWAFGEESKKKTNTMREMFYGALRPTRGHSRSRLKCV